MNSIQSVLILENNEIDNFINHQILEAIGITNVVSFKSVDETLFYLKSTIIKYDLILVDIYLNSVDGFEFIDKFREFKLHKTQGEICILTASISPFDKEKALTRGVKFLSKPLTQSLVQEIFQLS